MSFLKKLKKLNKSTTVEHVLFSSTNIPAPMVILMVNKTVILTVYISIRNIPLFMFEHNSHSYGRLFFVVVIDNHDSREFFVEF